jgi:diguanylate cyclase (GGDEF)-like protein
VLSTCAAVANTSLAVAAAVLLHVSTAAIFLIVVLGGIVFAAYSGYTSLSRRFSSLQLLYDFTRAVGGAQRAEGVVSAILDQARMVLHADVAELVLLTGDDVQRCFHVRAADGEALSSEITHRDQAPLWDIAVNRAEVAAIARHTKSAADRALLHRVDARDLVVAPLMSEGRAVGYLVVENRMGELGTFDQQDARLLETLANHASVAIENGRLGDRLAFEISERARQAATDSLTGLANRSNFVERVGQVLAERRHGQLVAVMLMDLDHFKDVNDTLGHNAGDEVLCQSAARVVAALDDTSMVARLGGDEFAVLLPDVRSEQDAIDMASIIRSVLAPPVHVGDVSLEIAASVGIALAPMHGDDAHALLRRADIAMYAAKREHGVQVYDAASDEHSVQRLALVSALREAIENDDLLVYFQPKVRVSDERVVGAEALVRWQHPTHGMLSPDVFIAIAERTGLIGGLTQVVARRAFRQCAEWRSMGFDLSIAVNVSVHSLLDVEFPDTISHLLAETKLEPEAVTLEITESTILDPKRTTDALARLAALGVKLSVDDFGTGYSSLTYLQRLPVHEVKVDRSFVMTMGTNESDAAIVKSIIDLGHNLGLRVVAEGVEDRVAWDRLARQGCDIAQGYFMSKPIPAEAFTQWLQEWEPQRVQPVVAVERAVTAIASWR